MNDYGQLNCIDESEDQKIWRYISDIPHKKHHDLSDVLNPSVSLNLMSPLAHVQAETVHFNKKTTESASQKEP